ncbi:probable RNA-directed DNA polymerase from transposon X-element [Trichonephila clavipes]|nr:probable RNA-directed DNA polymerase from transposon X-element [Trichonephila clavipes]
MANLPTDMELELAESQRNTTRTPSPLPQLTPCEQLKYNKTQLAKMETFRRCKQACVDAFMMMPDHHPEEPFYVRALTELQDIEEAMALAVSDIDSFEPCIIPGCPHHEKTPQNSPLKSTPNTNYSGKRKETSNFEYPPKEKRQEKRSLKQPRKLRSSRQRKQPQWLEQFGQLKCSTKSTPTTHHAFRRKNYKAQMAAITKEFPKIRSRLTGEFLKLYTDSAEERRMAVQLLKKLKFQFYAIKSKAERPIKVVIKGLPRNTNSEEIKQDLELLGYTPDRVNQLIGRKNKRPLPIFLITLPRNLDNLKIFDLKTLNYLSIRVEGYDGKGVTQCYTCNNFNHSSENCHLNPRCLKCGETHLTRDCPIKQKLETPYCINCNIYGHMANYKGCLSFPKPPKGAAKKIDQDVSWSTDEGISWICRDRLDRWVFMPIDITEEINCQFSNILLMVGIFRADRIAQSDLKNELKKYNDIIWQKRLEALNTADNSLWRTQKFFKNKRPKIPPLNCATGTAVTDQQKANLLATNIKNNFVENDREDDSYNQNNDLINTTVNNFLSTPLPNSFIEPALPDEIIHYIKHVNAKKAPDNWKEAIIFPINKPGKDPHLASSYRPISLLSTIGKLTESIILHRSDFINENNILNPNQYGFTNKLSTLHPLLRLTENISEGFQKKKSTGAVFLDIQKAFDRVWINGLTFKLITFKIPNPLIHLIHSYLTNRSFRIIINETLSNEHSVSAGCPQGSLLGPLLFNLYINDIPDYSLTKINLYADDTAIHATYKKLETISFALNKHLLLLQNFYDKWKISINVEKSTAIIFTKKQSLPPPIIMYNKQIPWFQEAKYLGIIFDTHLTWKQHIYYVRDKFRKIMFKLYPLIGRNSYLSIENKVLLYTAVMRPILAYASPVWGYAAKTNINILDTLQNSLIRMIVKATRYMRNDNIRNALKTNSFKSHIQNLAINFFNDLEASNNINMQNLSQYTPNDKTKRPRRILLDSYNPP